MMFAWTRVAAEGRAGGEKWPGSELWGITVNE